MRVGRLVSGAGAVTVGLALGLGLAEAAFRWVDGGALPHLDVYLPDAEAGVRLEPGATARVRVADNPVTEVRINSGGFRGADWPAPEAGEVVVVGDSQVFGLGVEETETFSARLSALRGVPVRNAGVPTWGPPEFEGLVGRLLEERRPAAVVYVVNLANDLFEVERPNSLRHTAWDGWAVRLETAPEQVRAHPTGRRWPVRSHLAFAAGRWWYRERAGSLTLSEGSWADIADAGTRANPPPDATLRAWAIDERRGQLAYGLDMVRAEIDRSIAAGLWHDPGLGPQVAKFAPELGDPIDIYAGTNMEVARPAAFTARQLLVAAYSEERNEQKLTELAARLPGLSPLLAKRRALRAELDALDAPTAPTDSPLGATLARVGARVGAAGARWVVVALPLDVMVSPDEWAKYGVEPIDLTATGRLVEDVVRRAEVAGAVPVDPRQALADAGPGMFLNADLHLTPAGHQVVAEAVSRGLDAALAAPVFEGPSRQPVDDEFLRVGEATVPGSSAARCQTWVLRDWVRVVCRELPLPDDEYATEPAPRATAKGDVPGLKVHHGEDTTLTFPVAPDAVARVRLQWAQRARELVATRVGDGAITLTLERPR